MLTLSVSQLNRYVKSILEQDSNLSDVYLKAEISNFKSHFSSGHLYFNLKDDKASVKAVMFAGSAKFLKFMPEEGMEVLVKATVSLYEVDGSFQVYVTDMQPFGVGAVEVGIRQLTDKLEKKGYFSPEHKKSLPQYPQIVGVITSKTGAAIEDIKRVLSRRYPIAKVKFCPALVQGESAPNSLVAALKTLDGHCDVIIIGRGGGSKEDLWAFNNERLATAIFNSTTPIISAVGHESDISICDKIADVRAATPSMAAEIATPSKKDILVNLLEIKSRIKNMGYSYIDNNQKRLYYLQQSAILKNPLLYIEEKQKQLDFIHKTMYNHQRDYFFDQNKLIAQKAKLLESLSPFAVLSRGYAAIFKANKPIKSVTELNNHDIINLYLHDGDAEVVVGKINPKGTKNEKQTIL